jgi:hypothetical protein
MKAPATSPTPEISSLEGTIKEIPRDPPVPRAEKAAPHRRVPEASLLHLPFRQMMEPKSTFLSTPMIS